jgi:(E)-2-((N-methylformamido)methylene)succinate hydrolase
MEQTELDRFTERAGRRLRFRQAGSGDAVVLIHGVGSLLEAWDRVAVVLGEKFKVIRLDLTGHGQSSKTPGPYSLSMFADDVLSVMDAADVRKAHVVGFSLGGLVAQALALDSPARVGCLVLMSTVAGRTEDEKERVLERLAIVADGIPGRHFENSVPRWFTGRFARENPELIAALAEQNRRNDPAAYAAAYRVLAESDLAERLHEIDRPTLVVTGENDVGSNTRMARLMHERIKGSQLTIIPEQKHSILTEVPDLVADLLVRFLQDEGER